LRQTFELFVGTYDLAFAWQKFGANGKSEAKNISPKNAGWLRTIRKKSQKSKLSGHTKCFFP